MPLVLCAQPDNTIIIETGCGQLRIELGKIIGGNKARLLITAPERMTIWREYRKPRTYRPDAMERNDR